MILDKNYWDNRYQQNETGWDIGSVSTPLKEYIDQLTNKDLKILIPGCGNAHEAEYLVEKGFKNVFLVDISPLAFENFSNRNPAFPKNNLICADFFNHQAHYDLIIEQTFFCTLHPSLRTQYAQHTSELLNPTGKLIGLLFDAPLNTDHPPFGGNKAEYLTYFTPFFKIKIMEKAYNSIPPRAERELFIKMLKK